MSTLGEALRTIARRSGDGSLEYSVACRCGAELRRWFQFEHQAGDAAIFSHRWHPKHGCRRCQRRREEQEQARLKRARRHEQAFGRLARAGGRAGARLGLLARLCTALVQAEVERAPRAGAVLS